MKLVVPTTITALALAAATGAALLLARRRQQHQQRQRFLSGRAPSPQYRNAPLVLVVDVGSSSVRASCYAMVRDGDGDKRAAMPVWVLLEGSLQQLPLAAIDERGEADIAQLAASVESLVDDVLAFLRAAGLTSRLVGVGFSTFAMNLLGVNAAGVPVTPVYTYAGRRPSTAAHARQLRELLTARGSLTEFHDRTGTVIHPAYAPAEFLRLHAEERELVQRVHKWQSISGFLVGKWTRAAEKNSGCVPMSFSEASWTGLFDFRHWQWDRALLELVHMDVAKMPPLADSSTPFVGLSPAFARRWPELRSVPFFLGIGDGAAANVGSKCIDSSRVAVTIGTSAAIRVVVEASAMRSTKVPKGLWCYRIGRDHLLLGGALNDGGSVYEFFRKTLRISDEDLSTKLQRVRANAHGLNVLPFLSGERAPGWVEDATCTISGITKWTTPVEVLYAALESVALRISLVFSLL
ncbi:hypothetical protein PybrP1_009359, partial [[Pythium] brassicae (nom. inval.)]